MKTKTTNVNDLILLSLNLSTLELKNRKLFTAAFLACFGTVHEGWVGRGEIVRVAVPAGTLGQLYCQLKAFYDLFSFDIVSINMCMPFNKAHLMLWHYQDIMGTRADSNHAFNFNVELESFFINCPANHPSLNIKLT